ncbi:hypothetical protein [Allosphingosinicella sp.]|uniref:hypothetical protein n=1 Tax=Allosphingosinicella sp. TaxID=2823234 RepID=UPI003782E7A5
MVKKIVFGLALSLCLTAAPGLTQTSPAEVDHFNRFCSAEIARMIASGQRSPAEWANSAPSLYFMATSRYFLPAAAALPSEERSRQRASPAELRELGAYYLATAAPGEINQAFNGVQACATRAALSLLNGGRGSGPVRPNAVASRPAAPPRAPSVPAGPAAAASAALSLGRTDSQASLRELNRLAAAEIPRPSLSSA